MKGSTSVAMFFAKISAFASFLVCVSAKCGGHLNTSGIISSPGFPQGYGQNLTCVWTLKAPSGKKIRIIVKNITIDYNESCSEEYLSFRESNIGFPAIHCGSNPVPVFISKTSEIIVTFVSDNLEHSGKGFLLSVGFFNDSTTTKAPNTISASITNSSTSTRKEQTSTQKAAVETDSNDMVEIFIVILVTVASVGVFILWEWYLYKRNSGFFFFVRRRCLYCYSQRL